MNYKILSIILAVAVIALSGVLAYAITNPAQAPQPDANNDQPSTQQPATDIPTTQPKPTEVPWELISGDPTDTCTSPTFTGSANVKGWYAWDYNYVEKAWLFRIMDEDLEKLPVRQLSAGKDSLLKYYQGSPVFSLVNASAELEAKLKAATAQNPAEITVTKFNQYCEGRAMLTVQE